MSKPIEDTEIRVIGQPRMPKRRRPWWPWACGAAVVAAVAALLLLPHKEETQSKPAADSLQAPTDLLWLSPQADTTHPNILHSTAGIDTVMLHIYMPVKARAELMVGIPDTNDESILLATRAADLRRDNGRIVGAFVLHGEPLSWGLSKRGYCAIIDGKVTIGVADNSSLFEQATEVGGDFFRQYAAIDNGEPVANNPENKSYRRALCTIEGQTCLVCSEERLTMNEFADRLSCLDATNAIFLVGGQARGWYRNDDGEVVHFCKPGGPTSRFENHILFRKQ